jgi:hypothetical protein
MRYDDGDPIHFVKIVEFRGDLPVLVHGGS